MADDRVGSNLPVPGRGREGPESVDPASLIPRMQMSPFGASRSLQDDLAKVPSQSDLPTFVMAYRRPLPSRLQTA